MYPPLYRRYLFLLFLLAGSFRLTGQPVGVGKKQNAGKPLVPNGQQRLSGVEKQAYWVKKGDALMGKEQNYTAAYSAYLLAKSLGAPGMSDKMQRAQQKNIEQLQANALILQKNAARLAFQAGLQQAGNMAETDLTQSLRLLEFLHDTYCGDSGHDPAGLNTAAVLQTISEVTAHPEQGLYLTKLKQNHVDTASPIFDRQVFKTDSLSAPLRQQVDSIFQHVTIPVAVDSIPRSVLASRDFYGRCPHIKLYQQGTYQFFGKQGLLFTFIEHTRSKTRTDSLSSAILWRTDGGKLTRLHTFTTKFHDWPHLSPDGQTLGIRLLQENVVDSIWHVGDTQLIGLKGMAGIRNWSAFIWFSPDSRYAVTCGGNLQGIVWRIIDNKLHYMFAVDGLIQRTCFEQHTVDLDVFNPAEPDLATVVTIDLLSQQQLLPSTCYYLTKGTNVYFPGPSYLPGDNYLMVQHSAGKPHIVLYAIEDSWLVQCESLFWADFRRASMTPDGRYTLLRPRVTSALPPPAQLWASDRPGHFQPTEATALPPEFNDALFSPDSRLMLLPKATKRPGQLYRLDSAGFRLIHTFADNFQVINCQFSPDGKWLFIDFPTSTVDSLWQVTPTGLGPAIPVTSGRKTCMARFMPNQQTFVVSATGTGLIQYYELNATANTIREDGMADLPAFTTLYAGTDQLLFSTTDTYLIDPTQKNKGNFITGTKRLSDGALVSPVLDDGETLFFVVNSELSRRKTLIGYDKKLRQPVLSREVTGAFDLHMTADKSIQLADPSGLYTIVPPRKILRLLKTANVAALANALREPFSPPKP